MTEEAHPVQATCDATESTDLLGAGGGQDLVSRPWKTTLALSVSFFLVCTSTEAVHNLQNPDNRVIYCAKYKNIKKLTGRDVECPDHCPITRTNDNTLSMTSFALIDSAIFIGAFLAPIMARWLGLKNLILASFLCNLIFVCSYFRPTSGFVLTASALLGLTISGAWMASSLYSLAASRGHLTWRNLDASHEHKVLSMFNGVFFCCFKASRVMGNILPSLFVTTASVNNATGQCGSEFCSRSPELVSGSGQKNYEEHEIQILLTLAAGVTCLGICVAAFGLPKLRAEKVPHAPLELKVVLEAARAVVSVRFLLLAPLIMSQGTNSVIMYAIYPQAFVICSMDVYWVGYVIVVYSISSSLSSVSINNALALLPRPVVFFTAYVTQISFQLVMLLWKPQRHARQWGVLFISPVLAGVAEGVLIPQTQALTASTMKDHLPSVFSAFQAYKCLTSAVLMAVSIWLCAGQFVYVTLALNGLAILCYAITEIREKILEPRPG